MSDGDDYNYPLGFASVALSVLSFGSFAVPLRNQGFVEANVHPIVVQCYLSSAVYLTSFISLGFSDFEFSWWGWFGAGLYLLASLSALFAISQIGIAIPQAIWSGTTIIVSFLWGSLVFDETVKSLGLAIFGIFFLCLGVAGVSLCNFQLPVAFPPILRFLYNLPIFIEPGEEIDHLLMVNEEGSQNEEGTKQISKTQWILGLSVALFAGVPNGSMMIPTKIESVPQGIHYLMSFSTGVLVITCVLAFSFFIGHFLIKKEWVAWKIDKTLLPGLTAGVLWSSGNFFAICATNYLGLTIGFPLTQTALLIAALWGLVYFKEITRKGAIVMFFISAILILGGATLLSLFG